MESGLLTPKQLRSSAWVRLLPNVYVPRDLELDPSARVTALRLLDEPGHILCGLTAAWVYGAWTPLPGRPLPLEVSRGPRAPGTPVGGYRRRRLALPQCDDVDPRGLARIDPEQDVLEVAGLRITSPVRTCFDLVRRHALVEAVAFADAFAYAGVMSVGTFAGYSAGHARWPAVRQARLVAELATPLARSPGESRLRMVVVLSGLGEPLVNPALHDASGIHLATPDLLLLGTRPLAMEYDGGYHDEGNQPAKDRRRRTRFVTETDIPLLEFDNDDLRRRPDQIVRAVERKTGRKPLADLEPRDFLRRPVRWS